MPRQPPTNSNLINECGKGPSSPRPMRSPCLWSFVTVLGFLLTSSSMMSYGPASAQQLPDLVLFDEDDSATFLDLNVTSPPCFVPYSLFPIRLCDSIDLQTQCHVDTENIYDEECAVCRAGRGYETLADCEDMSDETPPDETTDEEGVDEPTDLADLRDAIFNESDTRDVTHCSLSLTDQLNIVTKTSHPGTICPFKTTGLFLWHDEQAWNSRGTEPPELWGAVELPPNSKVVITSCSVTKFGIYSSITVPSSSQLIFADEDVALDVGSIHIYGRLRAGSETCRLLSKLSIMFHRRWWEGEFNQGIFVKPKGQLDLHGKLFQPTWTRISSTADAGSTNLELAEQVNWLPGQQLVITTTIWRDEWQNQNEVRTISHLENNGRRVVLTKALKHSHYGGDEYQAEVGLLSRTIMLSGNSGTESSKKGPHVHIQGKARIRGVQAFRMGQRNTMGAYPFHFHMLGDAYNSYIQDSSVYHSFYRGVVIHGTSHMTISDNVAFDVTGHCYYLEDGVEESNILDHNLASFVHVIGAPAAGPGQEGSFHKENAGLANPGDASASGFWISNPYNTITNNAASGGWAGFSFPRLETPLGQHKWMTDFAPHERPTKLFSGNSAHSSGYMWQRGSCIYIGGKIWHQANDGNKLYYSSGRYEMNTRTLDGSQPSWMVFQNTKVYLCQRGINHWGKRVRVDNYQATDITRGATLFGEAILNDAVISGRGKNWKGQFPGKWQDLYEMAGFQWYDTDVKTILTDITFKNYPIVPNTAGVVWYSMTHSDQFKPMGQSATLGIKYVDVSQSFLVLHLKENTGSSRLFNWIDYDGSATLREKPTLVGGWPSWWKSAPSGCAWKSGWKVWLCDYAPWRQPARLDLRISGYTYTTAGSFAAPPTTANYIGWSSHFGSDNKRVIMTRNEGLTGVTGDTGWYVHFNKGSPKQMDIFVTQVPIGSSVLMATRYPSGTSFTINRLFSWYPGLNAQLWQANSLQTLQKSDGQAYFFDGRMLYLKIVDPGHQSQNEFNTPLTWKGISVQPSRFYDLRYEIKASCSAYDGKFCGIQPSSTGQESPPVAPDYVTFEGSCTDTPLPGVYNCAQQKQWGKCFEDWMLPYCAKTCGRCSDGCSNIAPNGIPRCDSQGVLSKCDTDWISNNGFCKYSCGKCSVPGLLPCSDKDPSGQTCKDIVRTGKCAQQWVLDANLCETSCGRCSGTNPPWNLLCHDFSPSESTPCSSYVSWGSCNLDWMKIGNWCKESCGRCVVATKTTDGPPLPSPTERAPVLTCNIEISPPNGANCQELADTDSCDLGWMIFGNYCHNSCNRTCTESEVPIDPDTGLRDGSLVPCIDLQPWGPYTCFERRFVFNQCDENWMLQGGFCAFTCGFCSASPSSVRH